MKVDIRAEITNRSRIGKEIEQLAAYEIALEARVLGRTMVQEAQNEIRSLYNTNRPPARRRAPGTRRLSNGALGFKVESGSRFPIKVRYETLGGDLVDVRVRSLNFGSKTHEIPPGETGKLQWPSDGGGWVVRYRPVTHSGTDAGGFLEKGRDRAVARFRRGSVA